MYRDSCIDRTLYLWHKLLNEGFMVQKFRSQDKFFKNQLRLDSKESMTLYTSKNSFDEQRINVSTYQRINVSTYQRINVSTYQRINVST